MSKIPVESMNNLGAVSAGWLHEAGIHTQDDLEAIGSVEAYRRVLSLGVKPTFSLLWAMEAALREMHWLHLDDDSKAELKRQLETGAPR